MIDYDQVPREEIIATLREITLRLFSHFRHHVGAEEPTSPAEIFEYVMGISPEAVSIYKREYWWGIIKKIMSQLRGAEELFVVHRSSSWFVLKEQDEAEHYKNILRRDIEAFKRSMKKADRWVLEKRWRNI